MKRPRGGLATAYGDAEAFRKHWGAILGAEGEGLVRGLPTDAQSVLDLGAGVGLNVPHIERASPGASIVAADLVESMIRSAPTTAARVVMDATTLGFVDDSFDAVVMAFMLFHVPDPPAALDEVRRCLKPGGTLAVGTASDDSEDFQANRIWIEELDAAGAAPPDPSVMNHEMMNTPEKVVALLLTAGFSDVRTESRAFEDPMDLEEFITRRTKIGTSFARFISLAPDARDALVARARERMQPLGADDFLSREGVIYAWAT
jgi:SAM-dependent methyltransferase